MAASLAAAKEISTHTGLVVELDQTLLNGLNVRDADTEDFFPTG